MDILIFITDMSAGGRQTVCRTLVNELARIKKKCSLYVSYDGGENLSLISKGISVIISGRRISFSLRKLLRFVNKNPETPCLSLSTEISVALCFLKRLRLIRNPIFHRESMDVASFNLFWRLLVRIFFPALSGLIVASKVAKKAYNRCYCIRHPVLVISNPCRFADNTSNPNALFISGNLLLSIGRLDPVKGHDRLLQSMYLHGKLFTMQIWGDGENRDVIFSYIKKYNLEDCVELCGFSMNVAQVYASPGIVVLSSYHEGMPNVMIEALLNGCRVVVPECLSGACELLQEIGLGFCIVTGDYVSNLFNVIERVKKMDKVVYTKAMAILARKTRPYIVADQICKFITGQNLDGMCDEV